MNTEDIINDTTAVVNGKFKINTEKLINEAFSDVKHLRTLVLNNRLVPNTSRTNLIKRL